jgi:D-amino-acid dehydrogenase
MRPSFGLLPWLIAFARNCSAAANSRGTEATLELALDAPDSFGDLVASGVDCTLHTQGIHFVGTTRAAVEKELTLLTVLSKHGYDVPAGVDDGDTARSADPVLSDEVVAGFRLGGDQHLDPQQLLAGLESWLAAHEVVVHRDRWVVGLIQRGATVRSVQTSHSSEEVDAVVIAAGAWSAPLCRKLGYRLPLQAGKGYSFSVALPQHPRRPLYLLEAKVAVTEMAGRTRFAGMMELTGADARLQPRRLAALERHARRYFRDWATPQNAWAGLRPMVPDGLPVIGAIPGTDNAFLATGHAMLGITLAPVTAKAVADLLDGRNDPRLAPFTPARFSRRGRGRVTV